jgi:hypothetical protein
MNNHLKIQSQPPVLNVYQITSKWIKILIVKICSKGTRRKVINLNSK